MVGLFNEVCEQSVERHKIVLGQQSETQQNGQSFMIKVINTFNDIDWLLSLILQNCYI